MRERLRIDYLDTIRGFAAISVIASHFVLAYGLPGHDWALTYTPLHFWWNGSAAVALFFVLSGFVLSLRYFRIVPVALDRAHVTGFVVARFCRIWLPYVAVLLLSAALWRFDGRPKEANQWFSSLWREVPSSKSLLIQLILVRIKLAGTAYPLVPQAWTLAVELVLSLLVPLGVLLVYRGLGWLAFALIIAILGGLSPFAFHFAIGIMLAKHFRSVAAYLKAHRGMRAAVLAAAVVCYSWEYLWIGRRVLHEHFDWYMMGIGAGGILAVSFSSQVIQRWLSLPLVRHVGRVSYSIYLCHLAVLIVLTPRLMAHVHGRSAWWAGLSFTIAVSVAVAIVLYRLIEVPTIALGRYAALRIAPPDDAGRAKQMIRL